MLGLGLEETLLQYLRAVGWSVTAAVGFAFGVGIAGTNFGALVRYKIPFIPFFFRNYSIYTTEYIHLHHS